MAILFVGPMVAGCSQEDDILKQREAAKHMPRPTAAQLAAGFARMGQRSKQMSESDVEHAKRDPAWAAKVNAARRMTGAPLIGQ